MKDTEIFSLSVRHFTLLKSVEMFHGRVCAWPTCSEFKSKFRNTTYIFLYFEACTCVHQSFAVKILKFIRMC